jgi:hypothetical protein
MRPIEIMLLLANLLTFILLAGALPIAVSWMRHCALIIQTPNNGQDHELRVSGIVHNA